MVEASTALTENDISALTGGEPHRVTFTRPQSTVARRLSNAKATIPEFTVTADVVLDAVVRYRESRRAAGSGAPTVNDVIVKAVALSLRRHPVLNAAVREDGLDLFPRVNVGIAVAADRRLVVPTIRDVDQLSLDEIGTETRRLVKAVRDGTIAQADLLGGTFTVSNLGMYGVTDFTAIINPPQVAILAVGAARRVPVVDGDEVVPRSVARLCLVSDHRAVYGADAAQFLIEVGKRLSEPRTLEAPSREPDSGVGQ